MWTLGVLALIIFLGMMLDIATNPPTTPHMEALSDEYLSATNKPHPPKAFYQDGCSLFPDNILWHDFSEACLMHDIHYWAGGTKEERRTADKQLKDNVAKSGPLGPIFAPMMYVGVRVMGDSFLTKLVGANWGYGYNED